MAMRMVGILIAGEFSRVRGMSWMVEPPSTIVSSGRLEQSHGEHVGCNDEVFASYSTVRIHVRAATSIRPTSK